MQIHKHPKYLYILITLIKAITCNETANVIGKLTAEGEFDVDANFTGTPEFRVLGSSVLWKVKYYTYSSSRTKRPNIFRNSDTNGETITEIGTINVLTVNTDGIDVIGDISYTGSIGPSSEILENQLQESSWISKIHCS